MDRSDEAAALLVLIVEDELLIAMEMEHQVRALGYSVLGPAPNVEAADGLLDGHEPHAAILDVNLRGRMVAPIARRLHESNIPYALVTAYTGAELDDPALAGAPRLRKPVSQADLGRVLRRLLGQN